MAAGHRLARPWSPPSRASLGLCAFLAVLTLLGAPPARPTDATIAITDPSELRALAARHLGDPDLWPMLVKAAGVAKPRDVRPGTVVTLPIDEIVRSNDLLGRARAELARSTKEGARLFAPALMSEAIRQHDLAVRARQAGLWADSAASAGRAAEIAAQALDAAKRGRDESVEALLTDRQGTVEGRRPDELSWTGRRRDQSLIEQERVRTLSSSTAQITFLDESRLRLNANSQAVIQRLRVDRLSREQKSRVRLLEGDFYALLGGRSQRKQFDLEVPEVETRIESTSFWVRKDSSGAKFTNYDERVVQVAAQGRSVTLGRNEATLVRTGQPPAAKRPILPAPALIQPPDDGVALTGGPGLVWAPVDEAAGYWLEVAVDPDFARMVESRWGIKETGHPTDALPIGEYYWRVVALDRYGVPGERSEVRHLLVRTDTAPPFLGVTEPEEGAVLRRSPIRWRGESEPGAVLSINGRSVPLDGDGRFDVTLDAVEGDNLVRLEAVDGAGNRTVRERRFVLMPDRAAAVRFDESLPREGADRFVSARPSLALSGVTEANAELRIKAADGSERAGAFSDAQGRFRLSLDVQGETETFTAVVRALSGFSSEQPFSVRVDRVPPTIELDSEVPGLTSIEWLVLRGRVEDGVRILLGGRPLPLVEGAFSADLTLAEGGNVFELSASDAVGNETTRRLRITLDQTPPRILGHAVSTREARPGEPFTVEVRAEDPSGLRQAGSITLSVGTSSLSELLRYDASGGVYRAVIQPTAGIGGRVRVTGITVADYAGNSQVERLE